jgi:hypothetical protein
MPIIIDGPVTITPVKEPEPEPDNGAAQVLVFVVLLLAVGLVVSSGI